jgi:hypothetical protein
MGNMIIRQMALTVIFTILLHASIVHVSNADSAFFGSMGPTTVTGTLEIYYRYASMALDGRVPYRDYAIEYPLLAEVVFLVPRLFATSPSSYRVAFGLEMLLFDALVILLIAHRVEQQAGMERCVERLGWYTAYFAILCPLLSGRYDLAPTAICFASACWWFAGRNQLAGVLAGVGTLLKFFPAVVVVPALAWEVSRLGYSRGRGILCYLLTLVVGAVIWFTLGGANVMKTFQYHAARGLEIESLYAGAILLAGKIMGSKVDCTFNFGAFHLSSDWASRVSPFVLPIQVITLLLIAHRFWRTGMRDGVRFAGAAVLAFVITGKILSPQFMIWLMPFIAILDGPTGKYARYLFLPCCLTTTLIYPVGYLEAILRFETGSILLLNIRNALLLGILALMVYGPGDSEDRSHAA